MTPNILIAENAQKHYHVKMLDKYMQNMKINNVCLTDLVIKY